MTRRDIPDDDMPDFPWLSRRDVPETGDPSLAALLAWAQFAESSAPEMRPMGEILAALTAGPADDELTGEAAAMAAFRNRPGVGRPGLRGHRRRSRPIFSLLPAKAAAVAAATVLGLGALATAAYVGALPTPVQRIAHVIIGAPATEAHPPTGLSPARPSPTGDARATAAHSGTSSADRPHTAPTPHATRHPTTQPTPSDSGTPAAGHGKGKGKGKPTSHPTPHSLRKPTAWS